jgi:ubiquinone/menaquinone biosynthesis C-methylase UbiE
MDQPLTANAYPGGQFVPSPCPVESFRQQGQYVSYSALSARELAKSTIKEISMNKDARFWDKRAEKYSQRQVADQESYEKKLEITRSYFTPDSEVLEMGCGTGSTALAHAPFVKHILATDISPRMINIAKGKAEAGQVKNVTFETRAADDLDIPESRYDAILALNLLHLLKDPEAAIAAAHRGLKPGGVFITSTACIGDMSWIFRILAPAGHFLRLFPLIKVFTQAWLEQSHVKAGFEIDQAWLPKRNAAVFIVAKKRG